MPRRLFRLLGPTELEVMCILWEHGPAMVRDVVRALERPIAHNTIMTVLVRLAEKGIVRQQGTRLHGYSYTPLFTKDQLIALAVQEMLADLQPTVHEKQRALLALTA